MFILHFLFSHIFKKYIKIPLKHILLDKRDNLSQNFALERTLKKFLCLFCKIRSFHFLFKCLKFSLTFIKRTLNTLNRRTLREFFICRQQTRSINFYLVFGSHQIHHFYFLQTHHIIKKFYHHLLMHHQELQHHIT